MASRFATADDLSPALALSCALLLGAYALVLLFELRQRRGAAGAVILSGLLAMVTLGLLLLRPVRVTAEVSLVGARVVVLVDRSRRLLLPDRDTTRDARARQAARAVSRGLSGARITLLGFGEAAPTPFSPDDAAVPSAEDSDLSMALGVLARGSGERPDAVVVVSDGRLTRPGPDAETAELKRLASELRVPIHTVNVASETPPDAAIRRIRASGSAVAHQPLALRLEIQCSGGLRCGDVPVTVRELRRNAEAAVLASGVAKLEGKTQATLELSITIDRAGSRVVEIGIQSPKGDRIPDNDRRILTFNVARQRIRILHVAGRPTYDVRSLRMWLKSDESVDLVAFFILRTNSDDPLTPDESELALIPFPVDELFTEHLPSFDAVILQDIDAVEYRLSQHLPALERYVRSGGGLVMVGGPSAFAGGGYAGSPLERVLPVEIGDAKHPFDLAGFVPRYTEAGRAAPVLQPLRELVSEDLPMLVGSNTVGRARDGAIVLWEHPDRRSGDAPMPLLALGDAGDGRTIALAVDGTHELAFSRFAERTAGRAYGALWDGLIGWLMRQPRYEAARIEALGPCVAGERARVRLTRLPFAEGDANIEVRRLGTRQSAPVLTRREAVPSSGVLDLDLGKLQPGGYVAQVRMGAAPPTRFDFACERGGQAWADTRPDPEGLARIAEAAGGESVSAADAARLPLPPPTEIAAERHVSPLVPPWLWALLSATALGWHWIERRRAGLV